MPMTTRTKITTTAFLLLALAGVGIADYQLAGREYAAELLGNTVTTTGTQNGVAKAEEADVAQTIAAEGLVSQPSDELSFLAQVSAADAQVRTLVILQENDRIGSVSWLDGDAKGAFIALKESLLSAFSARVEGLSDRTIQEANRPVLNVLTFRDPALSEETLTFVRIRERLYEVHAAPGKEAAMQKALEALVNE